MSGTAARVVTMGRCGIDIYPLQTGVGLEDVATFGKFLGGSPTNVAVAAARLGHAVATISCVGADPFGRYVHRELRRLGVDDQFVADLPGVGTPVTICEIFPPDQFPLWFYRCGPSAHLELSVDQIDGPTVHAAQILWLTTTGLSAEPSRSAHFAALAAREGKAHTVLDLDYRHMFWDGPEHARELVADALGLVTVAVGNAEECQVATGEDDPDRAADALLAAGVRLAVVKLGPGGVLAKTADERVRIGATTVPVVNGLGAGDAFGGGLCHGLLNEWPLRRTVEFASAAGAIVAARLECSTAMPSETEVREVLNGGCLPERAAHSTVRDQGAVSTARLAQVRATSPYLVAERLAERASAAQAPVDAPMVVIAADHPARGTFAVGTDPTAMADRRELLDRIAIALARPGVTGFLGTADLVEDLALMGVLEGQLVLGSMNRGGVADTSFEIDDRFTGYDVAGIQSARLDGGKMLLRIDPHDGTSVATMQACAHAVNDLAAARLLAVIEPFWSTRADGRRRNILTADAVARAAAIASGLGRTSAYTWLKLPVVEKMEQVMAATTLPTLVLGGDVGTDPDATYAAWDRALALPGVRGLAVGRSLLFPADGDVAAAVDTAVSLW